MQNQIRITTYIDHSQKKWLDDNSRKTRKKDSKDKPSFSEYIRKALDEYIEREGTKC